MTERVIEPEYTVDMGNGSSKTVPAKEDHDKDPIVYAALELIISSFGFPGIGHILAGNATRGLLILFGYWAFVVTEVIIMIFSFFICSPILMGNLVYVIGSAYWLYDDLKKRRA